MYCNTYQRLIALPSITLVAIALLTLMGRAAAADQNWTGRWDTHWRDAGAALTLRQDGTHVTGAYPLYDGQVEATAQGDQLRGRWTEGARSGQFEFSMAPDGASFTGRYDNGEWWTGGRNDTAHVSLPIDQSGVREAMRTFVEGGNLAESGVLEELGVAAAVLDFSGRPETLAQGEKLAVARALHRLVDLTTFQLWSLPGLRTPGTTFTAQLRQAGTDASLSLEFRKQGDKWFIVAPSDDALAAGRKAMLARYGGRPPEPSAYLQRRSARDAMTAFLADFAEWNQGGRDAVLDTLDTSRLFPATRDYEGLLAAQYLVRVLQRVKDIIPQEIPDDPADRQPYVVFNHPQGEIVIAPVGDGDKTVWKFTADTVQDIRALYSAVQTMPLAVTAVVSLPRSEFFEVRGWVARHFPGSLQRLGPVEQWQITGALIGLLACLAVAWAVTLVVGRFIRWDVGGKTLNAERALRWPLRLALAAALFKLEIPALGWPEGVRQYSAPIHAILIAVFGVWSGWYLIDLMSHNIVARVRRTEGGGDDITLSLCLGGVRLALVLVAATYVANALSLPTNGVLAGLGLGGLAFAFASKETLSNVFGAGILVADRPFRKGDWITAGDVQGTVEKVGIRSTRIRTIEDTEAIVPNGKLSDTSIQNWGSRRNRLVKGKLTVNYGATPAAIDGFMEDVRRAIGQSCAIIPERMAVGITGLSERGIEIEFSCYVAAANGMDEKSTKSRLILDVLHLAEERGLGVGPEIADASAPARVRTHNQ